MWAPSKRLRSSQALLMASHISMVSAVRSARALWRATAMQLLMLDGLSAEKARKSMTESRSVVVVHGLVGVERAGRGERRFPFVGLADIGDRRGGEAAGGVDDAGGVVGALDVAGQPEQAVGGAAQHHASSTQVSLVPPPWLELTTSEPCLRATRVSPPGTMRTRSAPDSTNGRRSTWRGAMPDCRRRSARSTAPASAGR